MHTMSINSNKTCAKQLNYIYWIPTFARHPSHFASQYLESVKYPLYFLVLKWGIPLLVYFHVISLRLTPREGDMINHKVQVGAHFYVTVKTAYITYWGVLVCNKRHNFTIARKSGNILFTYWKYCFRPTLVRVWNVG